MKLDQACVQHTGEWIHHDIFIPVYNIFCPYSPHHPLYLCTCGLFTCMCAQMFGPLGVLNWEDVGCLLLSSSLLEAGSFSEQRDYRFCLDSLASCLRLSLPAPGWAYCNVWPWPAPILLGGREQLCKHDFPNHVFRSPLPSLVCTPQLCLFCFMSK